MVETPLGAYQKIKLPCCGHSVPEHSQDGGGCFKCDCPGLAAERELNLRARLESRVATLEAALRDARDALMSVEFALEAVRRALNMSLKPENGNTLSGHVGPDNGSGDAK